MSLVDIDLETLNEFKDPQLRNLFKELVTSGVTDTENKTVTRLISKYAPLHRDTKTILIGRDERTNKTVLRLKKPPALYEKALDLEFKHLINIFKFEKI